MEKGSGMHREHPRLSALQLRADLLVAEAELQRRLTLEDVESVRRQTAQLGARLVSWGSTALTLSILFRAGRRLGRRPTPTAHSRATSFLIPLLKRAAQWALARSLSLRHHRP